METKTRDIKLLIYLSIVALMFCVAYFGIYPVLIKTKNTKKEYSAYKKMLKEKEETLQDFNEAAAIYKKKSSDFKKIDQLLLGETSDKVFLLVQFEVLASKNNMTTESFSFGESAGEEGGLGTLPVNLSVKGKYSNFKRFLDSIATNLPLMEVETIQFSPSGENSDLYNFILTVNVYTKEAPKSVESQEGQAGSEQSQSGTSSSSQTTPPSPSPTNSAQTSSTPTPTSTSVPATTTNSPTAP